MRNKSEVNRRPPWGDLAREWMASRHFGGWRRGMMTHERALYSHHAGSCPVDTAGGGIHYAIPDLSHPGTVAWLLQDVRRAHVGGEVYVMYRPSGFTTVITEDRKGVCTGEFDGPTEPEALMAALRAAA